MHLLQLLLILLEDGYANNSLSSVATIFIKKNLYLETFLENWIL
jgi:hypothetical protein